MSERVWPLEGAAGTLGFTGRRKKGRHEGRLLDFKKAFQSACREAQIEGFHFRDLRHPCDVRLVESGDHARVIQPVLRDT
jgi:integrase